MKSLTKPYLIIGFLILLNSCSSESDTLYGYIKYESNGNKILPFLMQEGAFEVESKINIDKNENIDFNPFNQYLNRDFLKKSVASRYFLDEVPGHIYKKLSTGEYQKISIKRFVLNNKYPKTKTVDKIYYNDRVTDQKQLKATAKILGVNITSKQVAELLMKDDVTVYIPDSIVDISRIETLINRLDSSLLGDYYFAHGATLSSIVHRVYAEQKFTAKVDFLFLTANRKSYSSRDNFKMRMDVCLELTSLKDYKVIIETKKELKNSL